MMTAFSFLWIIRRALARISVTVVPGVSSTRMSSLLRSAIAASRSAISASLSLPVRMPVIFTMAFAHMRRWAISLPDISREKKPTV